MGGGGRGAWQIFFQEGIYAHPSHFKSWTGGGAVPPPDPPDAMPLHAASEQWRI